VVTTGVLYVALFLAHVARVAAEGASPLNSPVFVVTSLGALAMAAWSARVLKTWLTRPMSSTDAV
jgi:hypothetical protein